MATYRFCKLNGHGIYEGKTCPKCPTPTSKRSTKYADKVVIIPPHMRSN